MTTNRRTVLRGLFTGGTALGLSGLGMGAATPAIADESGIHPKPWYQQTLAGTREATSQELTKLTDLARSTADDHGYSDALVKKANAKATMSVNPRGNKFGKCSLVLDDSSVLISTTEFGRGKFVRQATQVFWTDRESVVIDVIPHLHAQKMNAGKGSNIHAIEAASSCCGGGASLGKCCKYDLKGLFECCGPCGFTLPSPVVFIACALIWCNYCNTSYCKKWYRVC